MKRRDFVRGMAMAAVGRSAFGQAQSNPKKPKTVLLRSAWQAINIGDIGHTPGALQTIYDFCPDVQVILWPGVHGLEEGAGEFLRSSFPRLAIAKGSVVNGAPSTPELREAWKKADFLLHSSGSNFPAHKDVAAWRIATKKPYGVFPVSLDPVTGFGPGQLAEGGTLEQLRAMSLTLPPEALDGEIRRTINGASFMFCRDSISLSWLKHAAVKPPILELGPDTQFGMIQRDDSWGREFMSANGLKPNEFICVVPRTRCTMYTTDKPDDAIRAAINAKHLDHDMGLLRSLVTRYIQATGKRVLLCPEMTYQMELGKKEILDRLPPEIARSVVWKRDFWLPNQAAAVYAHAQAVVSMECHSPIIALVQGTPILYLRQPTDTCKGQMYPDFGLADWLLEIDDTTEESLWNSLQSILERPAAAHEHVATSMRAVRKKQIVMGNVLRKELAAINT